MSDKKVSYQWHKKSMKSLNRVQHKNSSAEIPTIKRLVKRLRDVFTEKKRRKCKKYDAIKGQQMIIGDKLFDLFLCQ